MYMMLELEKKDGRSIEISKWRLSHFQEMRQIYEIVTFLSQQNTTLTRSLIIKLPKAFFVCCPFLSEENTFFCYYNIFFFQITLLKYRKRKKKQLLKNSLLFGSNGNYKLIKAETRPGQSKIRLAQWPAAVRFQSKECVCFEIFSTTKKQVELNILNISKVWRFFSQTKTRCMCLIMV